MSELKDHRFCECDEIFYEYRGQLSNEMRPYYLKSEADKVIAELKESVKGLILDNYLKDKETRHHKYKRCLAMAKLCRSVWAAAIFIHEKGGTDKQAALYTKWEKCWLSLADKFKDKEAK